MVEKSGKKGPVISLEGKVALVTGARQGIGKAIALVLAEAGADVAVCDNKIDDGQLHRVAREIKKLGCRSLAVKADVSRMNQVERLAGKVLAEFGTVDILVNNAGISGFMMDANEQWNSVLGVNLNGCYYCSKVIAETMIARGSGNIINIASVEGLRAGVINRMLPLDVIEQHFPNAPDFTARPYNVTKAGVIMMTRTLARRLGEHGIRVNAIAPGGVRTEMLEPLLNLPESVERIEAAVPLKRICDPREIANVALFLASELSSYVTGHVLIADGGMLA